MTDTERIRDAELIIAEASAWMSNVPREYFDSHYYPMSLLNKMDAFLKRDPAYRRT